MSVWAQIVEHYQSTEGVAQRDSRPYKTKEPPTEKQCVLCKEVKPRSEFYAKVTHSPNAISSMCKPCSAIKNQEFYQKKKAEKEKK